MSARLLHPDEYELASRSSLDSEGTFDLDEVDYESQSPTIRPGSWPSKVPILARYFSSSRTGYRRLNQSKPPIAHRARRRDCRRSFVVRRACFVLHVVLGAVVSLVALTAIFAPSYTHLPPHYEALRRTVSESNNSGRGNPRHEKVFIAASLFDRDGEIARGPWGQGVLSLIELLGAENVFLSIYENDSGAEGENALRELEQRLTCNSSIVSEAHFDLNSFPAVTVPGGSKRIKRIEYLAEIRNRALLPLDEHPEIRYNKVLVLNDVIFDPLDAVQLLFSTNAAETGEARYRASCAVDFINPFKFYDTYATRDLEGYETGVPFFPWFSSAGEGESRKDVLAEKDAVRVRSCWGGMVAFDAQYFQRTDPVRFRSNTELFWEGSECCLIHADIQDPAILPDATRDMGIYMNPFVRVAYHRRSFSWLRVTRRFERLYPFIHNMVTKIANLPRFNPRRTEIPGQRIDDFVWVPHEDAEDGGFFQTVSRVAENDGFCGRRNLQVLVMDRQPGQDNWEQIPVPKEPPS